MKENGQDISQALSITPPDVTEKKLKVRKPYLGLFFLGVFFFMVIFADLISPYDPFASDLSKGTLPPSWQEGGTAAHLLGTDFLGRDQLSRIIHGSRMSLVVSVGCILIYGTIGIILGLISGFFGGKTDMFIMRLSDIWQSVPGLIVILLLVSVIGASAKTVIISIGITGWPQFARVVRGECLSLKERDFVRLARVAGCSNFQIMASHIFPNIINTLLVLSTIQIAGIIVLSATLSFLGLGTQPPSCDWGLMLAEGRQYITYAWWLVTFPGIAIAITVIGFNLTGDWLREILDPKQMLR